MANCFKCKPNDLRRARFIVAVLFGAFAYFYTVTLQGESVLACLRQFATSAEGAERLLLVEPWHVGGVAMASAMLASAVLLKCMPLHVANVDWRKVLWGTFAAMFLFCLLTSPAEERTIELRMQRLNQKGEYADALKTGATRENPSTVILHERMVALEHLGTLGEDFFAFPLGKEIPAVTSRFASVSSSRVRLGLLLARDLQHLGKICKHLPADSLQQAEKEALVLYAHTWLHADCCFSDAAIEANYLDFQHMRKEIRREHHISGHHSIIETNLMREAYGRTYWYYYYYGQRR